MKRLGLIFIWFFCLYILGQKYFSVYAGGGPIEVRLGNVRGYVGQAVKFDVYFHPTKPDEILAQTMYLYLQDPKDGRACKLDSNRTDNTGKVAGSCTASVVGDLKFYIHWMEGGRSSDDSTITFVAAPPVAKTTSTPAPVIKKTIAPPPSPVPSPVPSLVPSPVASPIASPKIAVSPSPVAIITQANTNQENFKWIMVIGLSFAGGLGLPIIFYLLTKK
jgi:hypothetical protein